MTLTAPDPQSLGAGRMVYTLGTSTRSREEFLSLLASRGITRVCDVRSFPASRRFPHFNREAFSSWLREEGVDYCWLGEYLGGYRKGGYQAHMETEGFRRGIEELEKLAEEKPTAVICAELLPWRCHRRYISAVLQERGWRVVHILDARRDWIPRGEDRAFSRDRQRLDSAADREDEGSGGV